MNSLPTLRRKILRSFSLIVGLYAILGVSLVLTLKIASNTTPKLIHLNYDSISAALRMKDAWKALQFPEYSGENSGYWQRQFQQALDFESGNITETGEKELDLAVKKEWELAQPDLGRIKPATFQKVDVLLNQLIQVNEQGMFSLALSNETLSRRVLIGTLIYFILSLILAIFFADGLAERISRPLKSIAEALHSRPVFTRRLKLPEPTNLEMLILITELNRLWERLAESEKVNVADLVEQKTKLEILLESVEDGLLVLDPNGSVVHCNDCIAKLVGLRKEEIQGQLWTDLPSTTSNYIQMRSTLRLGLPESQQMDLEWHGKISFFSARSRKIETSHSERAGVLYLIHDITEKKQREKFRSEFIDLLSHELKTPLQSLGTASELLSRERMAFTEDQKVLIDTLAEDVERIRAVAQEFVQITQSQSKILKLHLDSVNLNQSIQEWIKPFALLAKDRSVKIEFIPLSSGPATAKIDLVKFPWVISNLLSNAIRYSPSQGTVCLRISETDDGIEINITDDGPGIPESEQARMFEPFYQSTQNTTSNNRGLFGIGLTIAKEVIEAHDGQIRYSQLKPHGSQFQIFLPNSIGGSRWKS